jgi:hypothetical protein
MKEDIVGFCRGRIGPRLFPDPFAPTRQTCEAIELLT